MTGLHLVPASFGRWSIDAAPDARRTLERMADFSQLAGVSEERQAYLVRYANEIIASARPRDYGAQIEQIRVFGRSYFRFVDNPVGKQRIRSPLDMIDDIETIGYVQGACDDAAVLMAALGLANGIPARFRAVAFGHDPFPDETAPFTHVIADLLGGGWSDLDITKPDDLLRAPNVVRTLILEL